MSISRSNLSGLLFPAALLLGLVLFWPGLTGPLFFDDFLHLPKLAGLDGATDTLIEAVRLAFPDHSGSGRSLAYLSLLIDDNTWPADPSGFKRTNLLLHLLNGVLVFLFVRALARGSVDMDRRADGIALVAMALWVIHPLHLSPVMMVIQRMTLLGGTFTLLALIAYVQGRRLAPTRPRLALALLTVVFGPLLVLGVLSKETALMTTAYVVVIELTVFAAGGPPRPRYWPAWALVFLALPVGITLAYLAAAWSPEMLATYQTRPFTAGERLLTEGRVLLDYLHAVLLPSPAQFGPFRDDYPISRGLFDPVTTLGAMLLISGLLGLALWRRRVWPWAAFAVLWFFLGHALEASPLPLEIYFEHRNYLPMLGLFIALGVGLFSVTAPLRRPAWFGFGVYLALVAVVSFQTAAVWGSQAYLATVWAAERPLSVRAHLMALSYYQRIGDSAAAGGQIDRAIESLPHLPGFRLSRLIHQACVLPDGDATVALADVRRLILDAPYDASALENLHWLVRHGSEANCRLDDQELLQLLEPLAANPAFTARPEVQANLQLLQADIYRRRGDLDSTYNAMERAYAAWPSTEFALAQAHDLASAGLFADAQATLARAETSPYRSLYDRLSRRAMLDGMRTAITDAENASADGEAAMPAH